MSSKAQGGGPLALVVGDPARLGSLVRGDVSLVHAIPVEEVASLAPFPSAPLILLTGPAPAGDARATLLEAARRGRNPGWFAVAQAAELESLLREVGGIATGGIEAPVHTNVLRLLRDTLNGAAVLKREKTTAKREARSSHRRLKILSGTLRAAGALLEPGMVSRFIMQRAAALVRSPWWRLYRFDDNKAAFRLEEQVEPDSALRPAEWLPLDRGLAGLVARTKETVYAKNPLTDERIDRELEWPGKLPSAILAAPMVSRGRLIGVAQLADPRNGRFSESDIDLVETLMEPAAIALDNAQLFRKLEERTVTDDLTQLYNARFMENYLRRETKRAVRYGHPVALLFIDLDGFKQVNDVHGHMAGSRTLVEVGEVLRSNVREIDVVARWGGDEFAVVLPDTTAEGAMAMAERIRARIAERSYLEEMGLSVRISSSIGVAAYPEHGSSAETLLAGADAAMYRVKDAGKNGVEIATESEIPVPAGA